MFTTCLALLLCADPAVEPTDGGVLRDVGTPVVLTPTVEAPFSGDFTWMNGQSRQKSFPLDFSKAITLSLYLDVFYAWSFNHPLDNTLTGTASTSRHNEFQINLGSIGIDWNYRNVVGRLSLQAGTVLNVVQDLDGTAKRGRGLSIEDLRYIREATLGYHFDVMHGVNVEGGIFMSYIGLESYLLAENWNYTRSVASDHTPFYFQGVRAQFFPTAHLKIEPWLMNGWQSYGKWNFTPSTGVQFRWSPSERFTIAANLYLGTDTRGVPGRVRVHHDHSVLWKYFDAPGHALHRLAVSINDHAGFEAGGADLPGPLDAHVLSTSVSHRASFFDDVFHVAVRGEYFTNPSRYLAQFPPPDLATQPGTDLAIWGFTGTLELMPRDYFSVRAEVVWRQSSVPYFSGPLGTTSADGFVGGPTQGFVVDSRRSQTVILAAANFRL